MILYFRELPAPLGEIDPAFTDIFFEFANTFTEESVLSAEVKRRKAEEKDAALEADLFRDFGYGEEEIAGMDIKT
jgi:hypothetical protein